MNEKMADEMKAELFEAILSLKNKEDAENFFTDLCTYKEIEQMSQRVRAAKLLIKGNTYQQVIAETDISSATLSRVSKCIRHGAGGYTKILK